MRDLTWDGYLNARDLGGLPTPVSATGCTLYGRVARGPRRELLTDQGWRDARAWGLSTVVDVRCAYEIGRRDGDPPTDPHSFAGVTMINAPTEDHTHPAFREACFPILDSPEYWRHNWRILPDLVLATLTEIADAPPGVLVHCSAGRDRTGMISTLLLSNAGVSPADISADYAESVRAMAGTQSHSPTTDQQAAWGPDEAAQWIAETAPIVEDIAGDPESAFAAIGADRDLRRRLCTLLTVG